MDAQFVENIVHEVKSQGVFDEFRKDSMADVDTKPAYQNLRQRVENTVKKFLAEQRWTPDTNKNQLRERLRRHITESGFLDVGVERIVDQVVNPKIVNVFQPRIEEIVYNYLGLPPPPKKYEQPPPPLMHPLPPLPLNAPPLKVETCSLLPTDLEQVSPESDKGTVKFEAQRGDVSVSITVFDMETDDKMLEDEDESPPFEPLVKQEIKKELEDIKIEKTDDKLKIKEEDKNSIMRDKDYIKSENLLNDNDSQSNFATNISALDKDASQSMDARISQDSQLSSVSSDSRLSPNGKEDSLQSSSQEAVAANISEEAQMPKFNENSSEPLNNLNESGRKENETKISKLHFDIKKDEIKFEGTERKCALDTPEVPVNKKEDLKYPERERNSAEDNKNDAFKFSSNNSNLEAKLEDVERTPNNPDSSFGSSIDDSSSVPANGTPKTSIDTKEKELSSMDENSPLLQTPKQQTMPSTPNTTPIPTPTMPTPTATPSPITSHKVEKDQSSRHSSSSSSKHKKHSKERRRSHEREKDKDRYRSSKGTKETYTKYYSSSSVSKSSKHSTSYSSKSSSSTHNKSNEKYFEKSSSSSTHSSSKHSKHSHHSSSSNEHNDGKNRKRDSERRHHSSSTSHKEHSSSKRSERKDDHNEAKHKIQRRKSTDSNDDDGDKSFGGNGRTSSEYKSYNTPTSATKSTNSKTNNDKQSPNNKATDSQKDHSHMQSIPNEKLSFKAHPLNNNVVILNDLLENPQIQFVQLDKSGHLTDSYQSSIKNKESLEFNNNNDYPNTNEKEEEIVQQNTSLDLLYFEESLNDYNERLELYDQSINLCRTAINNLRFDSNANEDLKTHNKSNLLMETLKRKSAMNYEDYEKTPRKRNESSESEECASKTSPTPSDNSVNSKENEEIDKNTDVAKKSLVDRHRAVQKLTQQQRYSSEDLYKPRPILGQRSRRRGMDSLV